MRLAPSAAAAADGLYHTFFVEAQMEQTAVFNPEASPREATLAALDKLLTLTEGLLPARDRRNLEAARLRVVEGRFNLVVLGEFKRGKSTLINALLERDLLPTGVVPLTSVVTVIGSGERERLTVRYADGREEEQPVRGLAEYVTEARNPGNRLGVELARLELDHELLRGGLELVDTPGIGSIHSHNTEVARGFLPRVDAALCVLDAGQPLSEAERGLFVEAAGRVPRLLMVINKIDHLDPGDRQVAVEFIRSALDGLLGDARTEVFAVSAREREGIRPLADRLRRLAAHEREALLLRSVAAFAHAAAADGAQAARFEARAIELPLDELVRRAELFERRIRELCDASAEAGDLLDAGVRRALAERVNEPLKEHARLQAPRLRAALHARVNEVGRLAPRALSEALERFVEETVRVDFEQLVPRFESAVGRELADLEQRYAARVQRILEVVQGVAEDVFGARAGDVLPQTGLRAPSRFSFKLKDVEHALDMLVGFGRTVTPGALGRRLVIRDAERRLIDMTDRHAGRLRSELAQRVTEAAREYRMELATAVEQAVDSIRAAIDRAHDEHRRGEQHSARRREQLAEIARRCEELRAWFEDAS
jgi:ribosome biogenesis GTPase A